jgi:C-8 sterol isomerase
VLRTLADLESANIHSPSNPNATAVVETLLNTLKRENPGVRLNTDFTNKNEWLFNNAGGAMGSMYVVHASITE